MPAGEKEKKRSEASELIRGARMHVELEQSYGADRLPFRPERVQELREKRRADAQAARGSTSAGGKAAELENLRKELEASCCCGLGKTRTHLVFGVGRPDSDLMFIGEAPGYHEDVQGIPFVGPAGQLLTKIIEAMGLTRNEVYIANICKCRPPENRLPTLEEVAACIPYLRRQIEIIQPRIIVTLGNLATQRLLETTQGITKIRGRFIQWGDIEVMPTFHTSYLLRNPAAKREVWDDMQKVHARMKELGLKIGELKSRK